MTGYLDVYRGMLLREFPWDMRMGLNLAFNRSFSTPEIAAVLVGTGELIERTRKRIDDTGLLMYEIILDGFDGERGRVALRRLNRIHRELRDRSDDEFLYVLACLVVVPLRWLDRYAWRRPTEQERQATYLFYAELGRLMNIGNVPGSLSALEDWFEAYDEKHLIPSDDAAAIERATRALIAGRLPRFLASSLVGALYDDRLRRAMKVPRPSLAVRLALHLLLKARALLSRRPRSAFALRATGTYPDGYDVGQLGVAYRR